MNNVAVIDKPRRSLIDTMSAGYHMDPANFAKTVRATCMPNNSSDEEFAAFLLVAHQHGLNPVTREIYAFPKKGGGIQPIVGIDGWMTLINSHPQADGIEFQDNLNDKGELSSITCRIYRKDRNRATEVTEYMAECKRSSEPWQKWPARMLRHKAAIQAARYAFGFAGIIDPEEAERSPEVITGDVTAPPPPPVVEYQEPQDGDTQTDLPITDETKDAFDFDRLNDDLAAQNDADGIEEAWNGHDVESTFDGDDENMQKAFDIKREHLDRVEAGEMN